MTVLRDCAKQLASEPPIRLYEQIMKLITDEQIASLQESLKDLEKVPDQKVEVERSIEACRSAARQYRNNEKQYGREIADFSVGAICDLAAMCTMMIAAGTERVEHLKQQLLGKTKACSYERDNGDRAYIFLRSEGNKLKRELNDWVSQEGKSVVQFKFPANGDLHTFAAERLAHPLGLEPCFYMYQAYQNTYSLSHFLGFKSASKDPVMEEFYKKVIWESMPSLMKRKYGSSYETYRDKVVSESLRAIDAMAQRLGGGGNRGQGLDQELFRTDVVESLAIMLDGELDRERYAALTGSHTTSKIKADYMMVLICDKLDPGVCKTNLGELYNPPQNVTKYLECSIGS